LRATQSNSEKQSAELVCCQGVERVRETTECWFTIEDGFESANPSYLSVCSALHCVLCGKNVGLTAEERGAASRNQKECHSSTCTGTFEPVAQELRRLLRRGTQSSWPDRRSRASGPESRIQGRSSSNTLMTFLPIICSISVSEKPSSKSASVIWTRPVVSNGSTTAPSKSDPSPTCSTPMTPTV
jgi:hypothetical protein